MSEDRVPLTTDEYLAIRFPNIEKTWLDQVNDMLGFLKKQCSGNGKMFALFSGGKDEGIEWSFKSSPKNRSERRSKRTS